MFTSINNYLFKKNHCKFFSSQFDFPEFLPPQFYFNFSLPNFETVLTNNEKFVDKSEKIYGLMKTGANLINLVPKGFGNSFLISNIEIIASNSPLIKKLSIFKSLPINHQTTPVIKFSFSGFEDTKNSVLETINKEIKRHAQMLDLVFINEDPITNLYDLIKIYAERVKKPYVLIDAYDKPIWESVDFMKNNLNCMKNLSTVIKAAEQYIAFSLITGACKLDITPINSGQSYLKELALFENFSSLIGFSNSEIQETFSEELNFLAQKYQISTSKLIDYIFYQFGGYKFNLNSDEVVKPTSFCNFLKQMKNQNLEIGKNYNEKGKNYDEKGKNYYEKSKNLSEKDKKFFMLMNNSDGNFSMFGNYLECIDIENPSLKQMLWQEGFLTIKSSKEFPFCELKFPNQEMIFKLRQLENVLLFKNNYQKSWEFALNIKKSLENSQIQDFLTNFLSVFMLINESIYEKSLFCKYFFKVFKIAGLNADYKLQLVMSDQKIFVTVEQKNYIFDLYVNGSDEIESQKTNKTLIKLIKNGYTYLALNYDQNSKAINEYFIMTFAENKLKDSYFLINQENSEFKFIQKSSMANKKSSIVSWFKKTFS